MIAGYDVRAVIHEGRHSRILRAARRDSGSLVIIKMLKDPLPSPEMRRRFRYEHDLAQRVGGRVDDVIRVGELGRHERTLFMEFEDFGAATLAAAIGALGPALGDPGRALDVAIRLSVAVGKIHHGQVIHKDLTPANILYRPRDGAIRIIDFGAATELSLETADAAAVALAADLNYIAPEQTGRVDRNIDHRADLYGMGAVLFHLFAGRAPFADPHAPLDAIGLIHAQIAKPPPRLDALDGSIPEPVADIVARLLEKDAGNRYQSAAGLAADLKQCAEALRAGGRPARFPLCRDDQTDRLASCQRLHGREAETAALVAAFERVRAGASAGALVLVRGYSGIGKSALVGALGRPVAMADGLVASGKFDGYLRDQPYAPFLQALSGLVRRYLAESGARLEGLAGRLREALGPNGQVILDVIPEVELILGPQPAAPELGPQESQNRFMRVFEAFLGAFAAAGHPLVLFLDDLQWADGPSLTLLRHLAARDRPGHLMLVGAYRDNEVDAAHPLSLTVEALRKDGREVQQIEVGPLSEPAVRSVIDDMLRRSVTSTAELAQLCHRKTRGNPFFLNQFLASLHRDGLLVFDHSAGAWRWDLPAVEERQYTDNVVDLVVVRIQRLPTASQEVLKLAACVGSRIELATLSHLLDRPAAQVAHDLWPLLRENLLVPLTDSYRAARASSDADGDGEPDDEAQAVLYRFMHDRVKQAAYALLDDPGRRANHLAIGRMLKKDVTPNTPRERFFDLVTHLDHARDLIEAPAERQELAALNLVAGRRAKLTAAFEQALGYLEAGLALLPADPWDRNYALTLDLHVEAAEAAYLNHDFDRMEVLARQVVARARNLMDRVRMREIELRALIARDRRLDAISTALPILDELGAGIVAEPAPEDYGAAFGATEAAIAGRTPASLVELPEMEDPRARAAMRLLSLIFSATYFAAPQLLPLVVAKLVELSARHGNTGESAFGYAVYGLHLCAYAGEIDRGYGFGKASRAVLDRHDARALRARTLFIVNICVTHWKEPVAATLAPLLEAYQAGLDTGDIEYATHALMIRNQHLYAVGHDLAELHESMVGQYPSVVASKEEAAISLFRIYHQTVANWLGLAADPTVLTGEYYDAATMPAAHRAVGDRTALFHMHYNTLVLSYFFGRKDEALAAARATREHLDGAVGVFQIPAFHFYESLVLLEGGEADAAQRIAENQEKVHGWAGHCAENNLHRWHLVEAERAARAGEATAAMDHFEEAGLLAERHGLVHEEGLAHERHALFWLSRGKPAIARLYLEQALSCYRLWGARAKVADVEARHREILRTSAGSDRRGEGISTQMIDVEAIIRAAEALSGALSLEDLMQRMMRILIENAGARRGLIVLTRRGREIAGAETDAESDAVRMIADFPVDELDDAAPDTPLCAAAFRYVLRSRGTVVLDRAHAAGGYEANPYIQRRTMKSLLCMPLSHQGKLAAVLYLENDLAEGAFTAERLELLRLLSGQMAVLIENARFYDEMMHLNRAYERFVPRQFLGHLGRESIVDVGLGDQVSRDMTVMFLDIRDFTGLSKRLTPEETFGFINSFLRVVEPHVGRHRGFVDKYTGDGLMALFPESADDAVRAALDIFSGLAVFNDRRRAAGESPVAIGIGLHTGRLMLGTIGGENRMDGTVISAAVNLASRVEQMNKTYGTALLISDATVARLHDPGLYRIRELGRVRAKGGVEVLLHEVFDGDPPEQVALKSRTSEGLKIALTAHRRQDRDTASRCLREILTINPGDTVAAAYLREVEAGGDGATPSAAIDDATRQIKGGAARGEA